MNGENKNFIARDRNHWREPSRDGILRGARREALNYAKKKEVPPDEIIQV